MSHGSPHKAPDEVEGNSSPSWHKGAAGLRQQLLPLIQGLGQKIIPTSPTLGKDSVGSPTGQLTTVQVSTPPLPHICIKGCQRSVLRGEVEVDTQNQLTLPSWSQRWVLPCSRSGSHTRQNLILGPTPPPRQSQRLRLKSSRGYGRRLPTHLNESGIWSQQDDQATAPSVVAGVASEGHPFGV